jgi:hypothetical protein
MSHVVDIKSKNPLLGTWRSCDPFEEDVQYTIAAKDGSLVVSGVDTSDGERPEIHGVTWSEEKCTLEFSAHWPSTGRHTKYRFCRPLSGDRTSVSYTFTVQQIWERV